MDDIPFLKTAIEKRWTRSGDAKIERYIGKFSNRQRRGRKITGTVRGNHGHYTVSIEAQESGIGSACSCYIGKHGSCHHGVALGLTFLAEPESFAKIEAVEKKDLAGLESLQGYLDNVTLDDLVKQLRAKGITQKAFCEAVGMSTQHLTAVKSSELRNRRYHELGAIKLAVLWVMEHFDKKEN
jgi:uncharacterized Zn finger protein